MKKLLILLILGSFFLGKAQETTTKNEFKHTHSVGLTVLKSFPSIGFGYRYESKRRFLVDIDLGLHKPSSKTTTSESYSRGAEGSLLFEIGKPSRTDFYIFSAHGLAHRTYKYIDGNNEIKIEKSFRYIQYIGFCVEFLILKRLGFNISMGYPIIDKFTFEGNGGSSLAIYYKF